jgi:hypothetical protein
MAASLFDLRLEAWSRRPIRLSHGVAELDLVNQRKHSISTHCEKKFHISKVGFLQLQGEGGRS